MAERTLRVGRLALPHEECPRHHGYGDGLLAGLVGATAFLLVYKGTEWYQGKHAQPQRVGKRRT